MEEPETQAAKVASSSFELCACCTRPIAGLSIVESNPDGYIKRRAYCSFEHQAINREYLRLCEEATEEARRHARPGRKGEIDRTAADAYLIAALNLRPQKDPILVPALT